MPRIIRCIDRRQIPTWSAQFEQLFPNHRTVIVPGVEATVSAFASAGFEREALVSIPQVTAPSLQAAREHVRQLVLYRNGNYV